MTPQEEEEEEVWTRLPLIPINNIYHKEVNIMVMKRGYIYHLMLLAALGAYVLDTVREGIQYTTNATERMDNLRRRKVMEERVSVL